ncbi:hypothetical protein WOA01_04340 [Methylocystis sp. IM2]|uniref:hypothetical protein n=1 Tax=unclassified Methylocystis TaxID=2625913 RepID=UPI0030FB6FA6
MQQENLGCNLSLQTGRFLGEFLPPKYRPIATIDGQALILLGSSRQQEIPEVFLLSEAE